METINNIELCDEKIYPNEEVLKKILKNSYDAYVSLLDIFKNKNMIYEWRYYKDGKAWLCKVQNKKKTIVWMSAWKGYIQATVYFQEKYIENIYSLEVSEEIKLKIRNTKQVGKSKPCIFEIRDKEILLDLSKIIELKILLK